MDIKPPLTNTFELIMQAGAFLDFLPPSRARSMVGTKLDEATLWLTQVDPDGPLTDEGQAQADDPFGIWPEDDAPENLTQTLIREGREILKEWPEGQKLMEERTARELNREAEEACKELGISYPEPTPEERRLLRSLLDRIKREQPKKEYKAGEPHFDAEQAASGIEALAQYASSPEKQVRTAARLWRDTVRNLDQRDFTRATSEMRTIIARIEAEAGLITPKTDDMASNIVASNFDPSPFLDIMERADDPKTGKIVAPGTEDDGA